MTLVRNADNHTHYPAKAKVFDVSGAGDTVVACITTAVAAGISIEHAVTLANVAAGIVVGKLGTAVAYADNLINSLHRRERATVKQKLSTWAQPKTSQCLAKPGTYGRVYKRLFRPPTPRSFGSHRSGQSRLRQTGRGIEQRQLNKTTKGTNGPYKPKPPGPPCWRP